MRRQPKRRGSPQELTSCDALHRSQPLPESASRRIPTRRTSERNRHGPDSSRSMLDMPPRRGRGPSARRQEKSSAIGPLASSAVCLASYRSQHFIFVVVSHPRLLVYPIVDPNAGDVKSVYSFSSGGLFRAGITSGSHMPE